MHLFRSGAKNEGGQISLNFGPPCKAQSGPVQHQGRGASGCTGGGDEALVVVQHDPSFLSQQSRSDKYGLLLAGSVSGLPRLLSPVPRLAADCLRSDSKSKGCSTGSVVFVEVWLVSLGPAVSQRDTQQDLSQ
ncbi:unnamed protein product [Gadus morhua 'NCC']